MIQNQQSGFCLVTRSVAIYVSQFGRSLSQWALECKDRRWIPSKHKVPTEIWKPRLYTVRSSIAAVFLFPLGLRSWANTCFAGFTSFTVSVSLVHFLSFVALYVTVFVTLLEPLVAFFFTSVSVCTLFFPPSRFFLSHTKGKADLAGNLRYIQDCRGHCT